MSNLNNSNSYTPDSSPTSSNHKFKSYLIEKLLNETNSDVNQNGVVEVAESAIEKPNEGDARSETGTYTIDDNTGDIAVHADLDDVEDVKENLPDTKVNVNLSAAGKLVGKSVTSPSIIELASARAAIDHTFGVVDGNMPESESAGQIMSTLQTKPVKRSPQKVIRQRNKTYSLRKDVLDSIDSNNQEVETSIQDDSNSKIEHTSKTLLLSSSSSASSSSSTSMPDNTSNQQSTNIKKTTTYEVISNTSGENNRQLPPNVDNRTDTARSGISSGTNVGTDLLLGDTEKLIEQLKLRRIEKTKQLKTKLLTANSTLFQATCSNNAPVTNNNLDNISSSSASSSSTNLSNEPKSQLSNKPNGQAWVIPTEPIMLPDTDTTSSTRATVDFGMNSSRSTSTTNDRQMRTSGGLAFDFFTNKETNSETSFRSENGLEGSDVSASSVLTNMTLTKRFELRRAAAAAEASREKTPSVDLDTSLSTSTATSLASPKHSTVSLGAKIAEKARINTEQAPESPQHRRRSENGLGGVVYTASSMSSTPVQYTNRTLYLRQENAKAKRNFLEKSQKQTIIGASKKQPANSGLNKSSSSVLPSASSRASSSTGGKMYTSGSKTSSRSNSQTRHGPTALTAHTNPIMTGSINLPASDSFQRRKTYDPIKAVEMDKMKRIKNGGIKSVSGSNERLYEAISNSDHQDNFHLDTSFKGLTIENARNYEKILQSTLQRLCIRLIQVSTGVLDKIGDNSTQLLPSVQFTSSTSELERMQDLAKLVHSMQLVHDHIHYIDSAVFNNRPEENYIKELSKIRQEVEFLKQSVNLNSPSTSSLSSGSKLTQSMSQL